MRLIDADKLLQDLENDFSKVNKDNLSKNDYLVIRTAHIALSKFIKKQATAYDLDKVVEHLETARDGYSTAMCMTATNAELVKRFIAKDKAMNLAIEIVKAGGMTSD